MYSKSPVFCRMVQGSIVDKIAFMNIIQATGGRSCIIIVDKGFYSKNISALLILNAGMRYILPLRKDTVNVEDEFYETTGDNKLDGGLPTTVNIPLGYTVMQN
jgi:transposase